MSFDRTVPINVDVNATRRSYSALPMYCLAVTSVFYTLQGEGPFAGRPAVFVRLAGCNFGGKAVACQGCDTAFSLLSSEVVGIDPLCSRVRLLSGSRTSLVVITGGEPLLQPYVHWFILALEADGYNVQIETNGTQIPAMRRVLRDTCAMLVISPKPLVRSGYARDYPISEFEEGDGSRVALKFLVCADQSSHHYSIPDWALRARCSVFLSPVTEYLRAPSADAPASAWDPSVVDQQATARNYAHAARLALGHGFRVSIQSHTFLGVV